jgi:PBSX family phage terminase large subunit
MILTPAQNEIGSDLHRFRVVDCGRRFGKTTLAIEEIKGKGLSKPSRIAYIAPTFQQARDIAWEQLKNELRPIIIKVNESRLELIIRTIKGGESLVILRGWEAIETLRGQQFDFIVIDEIASMRSFWSAWQEVIRPTLTDTKGEALFISTPKGFNHFYELFNKESEDTDYKSFHFTTYDNPFIPVEEIEKAKLELTEDRFAQEYLADFRKTEGLVYKEFDRAKHLFDNDGYDVRVSDRIAGIDFGFTNPTAVISINVDADNNYWVTDEWYKTGQTDAQTAEYVASCNFNKVYPDPESPSAIKELINRKVNVREVIKNKDSIKNGITKVRELFKSNRLHIHKKCENLIYELETYSYPDKKDLHNEEENPIKENDHAVDALRYAIMMTVGSSTYATQFVPKNIDRTAIPQLHTFKTSAQLDEQPRVAKQFIPKR